MKKLFFALAFALVAITSHARTYNYDVNKDGMVSIIDVTFLVNNILGVPNLKEDQQNYIYDVNGDGVVNVTDVTYLVNKILGILNPGEEPPSYLTCPDDHHPHFIDLGLPSGTKWACCNVGADKPEAYGGYYSWGETGEKDVYNWSTYTLCEGSEETCRDLGDDIAYTEYDVAHVKWGVLWRMPSKDQIVELINNCTFEWTTMNGVEGQNVTSSNGGSIFLPAAGLQWDEGLTGNGLGGMFWSSTQDPSTQAFALNLSFFENQTWQSNDWHYSGLSVRPVSTTLLKLSSNSLTIVKGLQDNVGIVSGNGSYTVASSNTDVATAAIENNSVIVTATGVGKTIITVTDSKTRMTSDIEVTVVYLEFSSDNLTIGNGFQKTVDIISGSGNYDVTSSNETVATAVVEGELVKVTAKGEGSCVISVTDNGIGVTETIEVTVVPNLTLATSNLLLTVGSQETVEVTSGSGSYSVASSVEAVATAVMEDNLVKVTAKGEGECTITVTDMESGLTETIELTIAPNILATNSLWLYIDTQKSVEIVSGSGSYSVQSSDEGVATALIENNSVKVTGVSLGEATIKVTDTNTGFASTIEVMVIPGLEVSTTSLYVTKDTYDRVEIISGSGYYSVSSSFSVVAPVELEGNFIKVKGRNLGDADIILTDVISGQTVNIEVNVVDDRLTLSENDLTITRGLYMLVRFVEGSGNYSVASRDETVATAEIEDNFVKVTATGEGQTYIRVTDTETKVASTIQVTVINSILLSSYVLGIEQGFIKTVEILSGRSDNFTEISSDEDVAEAMASPDHVSVRAKSVGTAYITVMDTNTGLSVTIKVNAIPKTFRNCPDNNHPHLIDLGLPSGTKWACCNMNANAPEAYGGYYAWGETEVKDDYSWQTYLYDHGTYCEDLGDDIAGTQYDVAHVKWGGLWVMPSEEQIEELFSKCNVYGEDNGRRFTASNGGTIFLPGGGYMLDDESFDEGRCCYWSSTAVPNSSVSRFLHGYQMSQQYRCWGYSIRPVVSSEK